MKPRDATFVINMVEFVSTYLSLDKESYTNLPQIIELTLIQMDIEVDNGVLMPLKTENINSNYKNDVINHEIQTHKYLQTNAFMAFSGHKHLILDLSKEPKVLLPSGAYKVTSKSSSALLIQFSTSSSSVPMLLPQMLHSFIPIQTQPQTLHPPVQNTITLDRPILVTNFT